MIKVSGDAHLLPNRRQEKGDKGWREPPHFFSIPAPRQSPYVPCEWNGIGFWHSLEGNDKLVKNAVFDRMIVESVKYLD